MLNRDGLLTLDCLHHLKLSEPYSGERRGSGQAEHNRRSRRRLKAQKEHLQPPDSNTMELYLDLLSQPCRAVFLFAKVAEIPFEFKPVDLAAGNPIPPDTETFSIQSKLICAHFIKWFRPFHLPIF